MSQSAPQLAFANVALRHEPCGTDKSSMRAEAESRTTLGTLAIIDERIVVHDGVASYIEEMAGRSLLSWKFVRLYDRARKTVISTVQNANN